MAFTKLSALRPWWSSTVWLRSPAKQTWGAERNQALGQAGKGESMWAVSHPPFKDCMVCWSPSGAGKPAVNEMAVAGVKLGWLQRTKWCSLRSWLLGVCEQAGAAVTLETQRGGGKGTCLRCDLRGAPWLLDRDFSWGCHCCRGTSLGKGHWFQKLLCVFGQVAGESCLTACYSHRCPVFREIHLSCAVVFWVVNAGCSELRKISLYHI